MQWSDEKEALGVHVPLACNELKHKEINVREQEGREELKSLIIKS